MDYAPASNLGTRRARFGGLALAGKRYPANGETRKASECPAILEAGDRTTILFASDCPLTLYGEDTGNCLVAHDQGITIMATRCTWAGTWCLHQGETRFLKIDFSKVAELADDGQTLTGTPTVSITEPTMSGIIITGAVVDSTTCGWQTDTTEANVGDWEVSVEVHTTGGSTLIRTGTIRIES